MSVSVLKGHSSDKHLKVRVVSSGGQKKENKSSLIRYQHMLREHS